MTIGEKIRFYRKKSGITQKKLSELSKTSEIAIRQYENGKRQPKVEQLIKIAGALKVDMWDLLGTDRETAFQNCDTLEEWGPFLSMEDRENYELQKQVWDLEEQQRVDYYYSTMVPILKELGYSSHLFKYNSIYTLIFTKNNNEYEIPFEEAKEALDTSFYLIDYLLSKQSQRISETTKKRWEDLHNSPDKVVSTYHKPDEKS